MNTKYTEEELKKAVINSLSIAEVCRQLGLRPVGGNYRSLKNQFSIYNINISHFTGQGWNVGMKFSPNPPKNLVEILVENSNYQGSKLSKRLILEGIKDHICEECKNTEWIGEKIPLELHHLNGINTDNRIENIKLLCPNCHAFTENYRGKSKNNSAKMDAKKLRYDSFKAGTLENNTFINKAEKHKKINKISETKHCLMCDVILLNNKRKFCSAGCYREYELENSKRPFVPELIKKFKELKTYVRVGEYYNVSDNTVKKWCNIYGIIDMIKNNKLEDELLG